MIWVFLSVIMHPDTQSILEVCIDKTNEKGTFVASQILATLHSFAPRGWKTHSQKPWFTFEIIAQG